MTEFAIEPGEHPGWTKKIGKRKRVKALSFPRYLACVFFLCLVGLVDAIYLFTSHYRIYTDIGYRSFCAVSKAINCDTVSESAYSVLLGLPVPVWGIWGYSLFLCLLFFARGPEAGKKRLWALLFVLAAAFCVHSIILAVISTFLIHSYCIMCILSYGVNFGLLYLVWLIRKRFNPQMSLVQSFRKDVAFAAGVNRKVAAALGAYGLAAVVLVIYFPVYWQFSMPVLSETLPTGLTEEGYPWIGAAKPELVITEFSDYQCFQCQKMHYYLRELIQKYPGKIRLIHRHFPLDSRFNPLVKEPMHVGSGKMALLAEYAKHNNKYWQMNDLLFHMKDKKYVRVRKLSEQLGLDYHALSVVSGIPEFRYALKHDIAVGIKLGITGTPAFVIDGKVYQGQIPPSIIQRVAN